MRACDGEPVGQAVHRCFPVTSCREDLRFNSEQFSQVHFHSAICRGHDSVIDREKRNLESPSLAQAFRRRADEARDQEIVPLSVEGLQRAPEEIETDFWLISGNDKLALRRDAESTVRF